LLLLLLLQQQQQQQQQQQRRQFNSANSNVDSLQYSHNQRSFSDLSEMALLIAR